MVQAASIDTIEKMKAWANQEQAENRSQGRTSPGPGTTGRLNIASYLDHYEIPHRVKRTGTALLYVLDHCLCDPNHGRGESAIGQGDDGKLFYHCFHNSCSDRTWHEVRKIISGSDSLKPFIEGGQENKKSERQPRQEEPTPAESGEEYRQIAELLKEGETGYATWVTREWRSKLRFDVNENRWFQFDRHNWRKIPDEAALEACGVIQDVLKEMAISFAQKKIEAESRGDKSLAREFERREKTLLKAIREIGELYTQKAVMHICRSDRSYLGFNGQWDEDPYLVATPSGILNLKDLTFRDGKPEDNIRTVIPTPWEGINVQCPLWEKTLLEIFDGNPDVADYLHRVFGYCLTGLTRHHHLWIFEGKGRNGKSLLYKILKYVLGELIGILDRELLLDKKSHRQSGSATPDVLNLRGKRMCFLIETSEGRKFDAGKLKLLSGGDLLHGRGLYAKDYSTFENTAKPFVMTNSRPHISGGDYASWQRIILFPFNVSFVPEPDPNPKKKERLADPDLEEKLKTEASGILAWLVNGYVMTRDHGLIPPGCIKEATNDYRIEEDTIGRFVEEKLERYEGDKVQAKDIYKAYRSWCEDQGIHSPKHNTTFGREMRNHVEVTKRGNLTFYKNIRIKA